MSAPFIRSNTENLHRIAPGEIHVGELIGQGGYSQVYRGTWNGKEVAIKQLLLKKLPTHLVKDFENETRIMAQCSQCNQIIKLFGVCMEQEPYAMVMDYMAMGSLDQILHDEKKELPWQPTRIQFAIDIGKGLSYLHEREILHRDLKSLNILVDNYFNAKISDFGLSKLKLESSSSPSINSANPKNAAGTIRWKAPELFKFNPVHTKASDVYSYGMILWEIASRKIPFGEADDSVIIDCVQKGKTETIPEETPSKYGELIKRTWSRETEKRPASHFLVLELEKLKPKPPAKSWHLEMESIETEVPKRGYSLIPASSNDVVKVLKFYSHHPVPGYEVGSIKVINNPQLNRSFEAHMSKLQERDQNPAFAPNWAWGMIQQEWREKVYEMAINMAKPYTDPDYPAVKLFPLWHATDHKIKILDSIFRVGYTNLSTDTGFFGRGLYSAHEAECAYRVLNREKGVLILNWVAVFSPFPVIDGDIYKLTGKPHYQNYDAHFIPISPKAPSNPKDYFPCKPFQSHTYTEVVVFELAACLPRYLVELKPTLTKQLMPPPISSPSDRVASGRAGKSRSLNVSSSQRYISAEKTTLASASSSSEGLGSSKRFHSAGETLPELPPSMQPLRPGEVTLSQSPRSGEPTLPPPINALSTLPVVDVPQIRVAPPRPIRSPPSRPPSPLPSKNISEGHSPPGPNVLPMLQESLQPGHPGLIKQSAFIKEKRELTSSEASKVIFKLGKSCLEGKGVKKDEALALKHFNEAAEKGHADAQGHLGLCYLYGYGTKEDPRIAVKFFKLAADQGQKVALFRLGRCYRTGKGVMKDEAQGNRYLKSAMDQEVIQFFQIAATHGNAQAQFDLANCYYEGIGFKQDKEMAFKLYTQAADQGLTPARFNLGVCYYQEEGVEQNYLKAFMSFQLACEQGGLSAQYYVGFCYENGHGVKQDLDLAAKHYKRAADQDHADAQYRLGICYAKGKGVKKDYNLAFKYHQLAANQGHVDGQWSLGICLLNGYGTKLNPKLATEYFKLAAVQNSRIAQFYLGRCYKKGIGVEKDKKMGMKYLSLAIDQKIIQFFESAAQEGDAQAQFDLANCYLEGIGKKQKSSTAVKYFQLAANQAHIGAQYNLGNCLLHGLGIKKPDPSKAVQYYILAAEQGDAQAQYSLGNCYDKALGVGQDYKMSFKYFQLAAHQDHADALYHLGIYYSQDLGTLREQDKSKAKVVIQKKASSNDISSSRSSPNLQAKPSDLNSFLEDLPYPMGKLTDILFPSLTQANSSPWHNLQRVLSLEGQGLQNEQELDILWRLAELQQKILLHSARIEAYPQPALTWLQNHLVEAYREEVYKHEDFNFANRTLLSRPIMIQEQANAAKPLGEPFEVQNFLKILANKPTCLLIGNASLGKSLMVLCIAHEWLKDLPANDFSLLVKIPLARLTKLRYATEDISLEGIIRKELVSSLGASQSYTNELILDAMESSAKILLVLDGYDQFPLNSPCKKTIESLLENRPENFTILVTSRPFVKPKGIYAVTFEIFATSKPTNISQHEIKLSFEKIWEKYVTIQQEQFSDIDPLTLDTQRKEIETILKQLALELDFSKPPTADLPFLEKVITYALQCRETDAKFHVHNLLHSGFLHYQLLDKNPQFFFPHPDHLKYRAAQHLAEVAKDGPVFLIQNDYKSLSTEQLIGKHTTGLATNILPNSTVPMIPPFQKNQEEINMTTVEFKQLEGQLSQLELELKKQNLSQDEVTGFNQRTGNLAKEILVHGQEKFSSELGNLSQRLTVLFHSFTERLSHIIGPAHFASIARAEHTVVAENGSNITLSLEGALADTSSSHVGENAKLVVIAGATQEIAQLVVHKTLDDGFFEKRTAPRIDVREPVFQGNGAFYANPGSQVLKMSVHHHHPLAATPPLGLPMATSSVTADRIEVGALGTALLMSGQNSSVNANDAKVAEQGKLIGISAVTKTTMNRAIGHVIPIVQGVTAPFISQDQDSPQGSLAPRIDASGMHVGNNSQVSITQIVQYHVFVKADVLPLHDPDAFQKISLPGVVKIWIGKAQEAAQKAETLLSASDDRQQVMDMEQVFASLNSAVDHYRNAKRYAKEEQVLLMIDRQIETLSWKRSFIMLKLALPLFLPNPEDHKGEIELFLDSKTVISASVVEEMIKQNIAETKTDSAKVDNPALCFFLAYAYQWLDQKADSARWYLALAQSYAKACKNVFLIRNSLDKARSLDPKLALENAFSELDQATSKKEQAVQKVFDKLLSAINTRAPIDQKTCYLLYHNAPATVDWVKNRLSQDLAKVGVILIDVERTKPLHIPRYRYITENVNAADFILPICTPEFIKEDQNSSSSVSFNMDIVNKRFLGGKSKRVLPFLLGDPLTSAPAYFVREASDYIDATSLERYYLNSLHAFCLIKGIPEGSIGEDPIFYEMLKDTFITSKQKIERNEDRFDDAELLISNIRSVPEIDKGPKSTFVYPSIPELKQVVERVSFDEHFKTNNIVLLTQPAGVLFKTGKTTATAHYAHSKAAKGFYNYIFWFDANNTQALEKQIADIKREYAIKGEFRDWLQKEERWLIVFDNLDNQKLIEVMLPEALTYDIDKMPKDIHRHVIITSRKLNWNKALNVPALDIPVGPFTNAEGLTLIKKCAKDKNIPPEACKQLVEVWGGVPKKIHELALMLAKPPYTVENFWDQWVMNLETLNSALHKKGNIPAFSLHFIVQPEVLALLEETFVIDKPASVFLTGMGKTHCSFQYALLNVVKYRWISYVDCRDSDSLLISCQQLAKMWGLNQNNSPEDVKKFLAQNKEWLMILDNVGDSALMQRLIPEGMGHTIITNDRLMQEAVKIPPIKPLQTALLVRSLLKETVNQKDMDTLCSCLQQHPQLIALSCSYILKHKVGINEFLKKLKSLQISFEKASHEELLQAVFTLTWQQIVDMPAKLVKICALKKGTSFDREEIFKEIAQSLKCDRIDFNNWLKQLKEYGVLDFTSDFIFIPHRLKELIKLT